MAVENVSLQTCPACGAAIDTAGAEPLAKIACPKCGERVRVERAFNNFVLLETLGVGGMGTVYKARDILLDRLVALKVLRKDLGGGIDQTAQLRQEARVAASVNHPNVIQVFSSGTDHGQFYLVMELVDHGSLDDLIEERKRLPESQVLEAGIQVAKGLRAAHGKGLIHRDVKPANILFADEQTAKVGDFGLAGLAAEKAETLGEIWGTPYYVAPERLKNEPEDFRSDIYSLGATLFHAASGKAPIEGDTNSAVALLELKKKPVDLRRIAPDVSAATARALHRMIAPDPGHRFASYDELVMEMERAHRSLTGQADVVQKTPGRRRSLLVGMTILAALLLGIGVMAALKLRQHRPEGGPAPAPPSISIAELERRFSDARKELIRDHHRVAHGAFVQVALDAKNRQPIYDWARLNEALSALVGREQSQTRQAFQEIQNAGETGFKKEDLPLAKWFESTARTMLAPETVPGSSPAEPLALFLFGLKDISQNDISDAATLLERFVNSQPPANDHWATDYKPLAQKYLDDCRTYLAWKQDLKSMPPAAALAKLHSIKTKMAGPIRDALNSDEKALSQQASEQQRSEAAAREQAKKKEVEQAVQRKPQWLAEWKNKLIQDLNQRHYNGAIVDRTGAQYSGIDSATADKLGMRVPYGSVQIDWTNVSPKTLLAVSAAFIQPNASDAADRQWLCAVYASETGQLDAARQFGEAAAKSKPEYQDLLPLVAK